MGITVKERDKSYTGLIKRAATHDIDIKESAKEQVTLHLILRYSGTNVTTELGDDLAPIHRIQRIRSLEEV